MEIAWLDEHLDDEVRASTMSGYRGHRADGAVKSSLESDPPPPELIDVVTTSTATRRPRLSPP
jgi:hypothetical protein